jgi:hypothetical protein
MPICYPLGDETLSHTTDLLRPCGNHYDGIEAKASPP